VYPVSGRIARVGSSRSYSCRPHAPPYPDHLRPLSCGAARERSGRSTQICQATIWESCAAHAWRVCWSKFLYTTVNSGGCCIVPRGFCIGLVRTPSC